MADLAALFSVRKRKRETLRKTGADPYPEKAVSHRAIGSLLPSFDALTRTQTSVSIAGRIIGMRGHGGVVFLDLRDVSGSMQALLAKDRLGEKKYRPAAALDIGDFLWVSGKAMRTKRGEATVAATRFVVLAKALRPLPSQWYGLHDVEERFRNREIDLLMNAEARERFRIRSKVVSALRNELERNGFLEVETPILQPVAGGANAEPFRTVLRALRMPLYLRVAPELYLKRLLVGGFEKVYELGRSFRNEGMDQTHNPEFTMLEFYWAYQDARGLMGFTEKLLRTAAQKSIGGVSVSFRGKHIDFGKPFQHVEYSDVFQKKIGIGPAGASREALQRAARSHDIPTSNDVSNAQLIDHLFKKVIAHRLVQPTFVSGHPLALSPLAKASPENAQTAARFQVYAGGLELVNAYSELNDPHEQRQRFLSESKRARQGDREVQRSDDSFLVALEYGMPPAAGFGLGIDRFVMLLCDAPSLREVIFFPTMRPKRKNTKK